MRTLKGIRNDLDLDQVEMAEKLGISKATYQRYKNYIHRTPAAILVKMADMAGIVDVREIKYK